MEYERHKTAVKIGLTSWINTDKDKAEIKLQKRMAQLAGALFKPHLGT